MIKCVQSETKALYGRHCGNHHQTGNKRDLVAVDYQWARRRDLVYRVGRVELSAADSLCQRPGSTRADGGRVGNTD